VRQGSLTGMRAVHCEGGRDPPRPATSTAIPSETTRFLGHSMDEWRDGTGGPISGPRRAVHGLRGCPAAVVRGALRKTTTSAGESGVLAGQHCLGYPGSSRAHRCGRPAGKSDESPQSRFKTSASPLPPRHPAYPRVAGRGLRGRLAAQGLSLAGAYVPKFVPHR
jgi:hypothetical protein